MRVAVRGVPGLSAPEQIVIAGDLEECGNYYPSAVEAEGEHGGFAVEYIRKDASDAAIAAARAEGVREGMLKAAEFCHWNAVGLDPRRGYIVDPWTEEQGGKHPGHAYAEALRTAAEAQP